VCCVLYAGQTGSISFTTVMFNVYTVRLYYLIMALLSALNQYGYLNLNINLMMTPLQLLAVARDNRKGDMEMYENAIAKLQLQPPPFDEPTKRKLAMYNGYYTRSKESYERFCNTIEILKHHGTT
jgi:hypothetical protein